MRASLLLLLFCLPIGSVWLFGKSPVAESFTTPFVIPKLYVVEALIFLVSLVWLGVRRPPFKTFGPFWPLMVVVGLAFVTILWSPDRMLSLTTAIHLDIALSWLIMLTFELRDPTFRRAAAWVFGASVLIQALWGIAQVIVGHDFGLWRLGESDLATTLRGVAKVPTDHDTFLRAYGSFPHPNLLAAFLAGGIFLAGTVVFWNVSRRVHAALAVFLSVVGIGLLATFSRAALLATVGGGVLVILYSTRQWKRLPAQAAIAMAVFVIAMIAALPILSGRMSVNGPAETGVENRQVGIETAAQAIVAQPYGLGAGTFVEAYPQLRPETPDYQQQPVHVAPLLIAVELGVIAMLLVVGWIVRMGLLFHRLRPRKKEDQQLNFAIFTLGVAYALMALADHFFWSLPQGLWLIAAFSALAVSRIPERTLLAKKPTK